MHRLAIILLCLCGLARAQDFDPVVPGRALHFPEDAGAHPGHRIEWWYVTGHLETSDGPFGFQVTFFRLRNREADANPSRFSPRQLLFAHAALADAKRKRFLHDQRIGRALPPLVDARVGETDIRIDDWSMRRASGVYTSTVTADRFALELSFTPTQPVLLEGERGFSRKGPDPDAASYYYSEPQLRVGGRIVVEGRALDVKGVAWLDHEWSSALLPSDAQGWDWIGVNLDDGSAWMAFRIRAKDGTRVVWASATERAPGREPLTLGRDAVQFAPRRSWKSPRTGTAYPVEMDVVLGNATWHVEPLLDDQELDARASTGTLYWEGAVRVRGTDGRTGRGYLELTGYAGAFVFWEK